MASIKVAVIPGDGIGKEVMPEGMRALEAAGSKHGLNFEWQELTIEFKINDSNYDEVSEVIKSLLNGDDLRELINSIVMPT